MSTKDKLRKRANKEMKEGGIQGLLNQLEPEIERALPETIGKDRFVRQALTMFRNTPKLMECDPLSIMGGLMTAAQCGLELGRHLGQAHLIPYGNEAKFQLGYQGMSQLGHQHPLVKDIVKDTVFANDYFEVEKGKDSTFRHIPYYAPNHPDGPQGDSGPAVLYYAGAHLEGGGFEHVIMTKDEVEQHRDQYVKRTSDSPWYGEDNEFNRMGEKTCIRRLFKLLPKTTEATHAVEADSQVVRYDQDEQTAVPAQDEISGDNGEASDALLEEAGQTESASPQPEPSAEIDESPDQDEQTPEESPEQESSEPEPDETVDRPAPYEVPNEKANKLRNDIIPNIHDQDWLEQGWAEEKAQPESSQRKTVKRAFREQLADVNPQRYGHLVESDEDDEDDEGEQPESESASDDSESGGADPEAPFADTPPGTPEGSRNNTEENFTPPPEGEQVATETHGKPHSKKAKARKTEDKPHATGGEVEEAGDSDESESEGYQPDRQIDNLKQQIQDVCQQIPMKIDYVNATMNYYYDVKSKSELEPFMLRNVLAHLKAINQGKIDFDVGSESQLQPAENFPEDGLSTLAQET